MHRVRPAWRGGGGGSTWTVPPGAPSDPNPPSALPDWATLWVALAMLWSWGARPPYCSGALPRAAPGRGPRATPARWCKLAHRPRPPWVQAAGGARARGVQVQLRPLPRVAVPSAGGGASPRLRGGGGSALLRPSSRGGSGGGGGGGAAPPPPRPVRCRPAILSLERAPPGYTRAVGVAGRPWASGAAWSAANGSVRRGGEGNEGVISLPLFAPPPSPGRPLKGPLCSRRPGHR